MAVNNHIISGRLTKEPEVRNYYTTKGEVGVLASFTVAVDRKINPEYAAAIGRATADYFPCTAFGKKAEWVQQYLHKGVKVIVVGDMQNDNYLNKTGGTNYSFNLIVKEVDFASDPKPNTAMPRQAITNPYMQPQNAPRQAMTNPYMQPQNAPQQTMANPYMQPQNAPQQAMVNPYVQPQNAPQQTMANPYMQPQNAPQQTMANPYVQPQNTPQQTVEKPNMTVMNNGSEIPTGFVVEQSTTEKNADNKVKEDNSTNLDSENVSSKVNELNTENGIVEKIPFA